MEGNRVTVENPSATVVILHTFGGLSDFEIDRAEVLADAGYSAFAADLYASYKMIDNLSTDFRL